MPRSSTRTLTKKGRGAGSTGVMQWWLEVAQAELATLRVAALRMRQCADTAASSAAAAETDNELGEDDKSCRKGAEEPEADEVLLSAAAAPA